MAGVLQRPQTRMSVAEFRRFVEDRPDKERWELIDGVAMMMTPPTIAHQIIATNLLLLLREALARNATSFRACPAIGVNLGAAVENYDPEPDVVIIDSIVAETAGERYAPRFYLAAEVISLSDRPFIESKRAVYKRHDACKCILTIQQDRFEVRIDQLTATGWIERTLLNPDDLLMLEDFGLRCTVSDLYQGTSLAPRDRKPV